MIWNNVINTHLEKLWILSFFGYFCVVTADSFAHELDKISLPNGFSINIFADNIVGARSLVVGNNGVVFVSSPSTGKIMALQDKDSDGISEKRWLVASKLNFPNGLAFFEGSLYVGEIDRVIRIHSAEDNLGSKPIVSTVISGLPKHRHHGYRYIGIGPDKKLYIGIGAPCNVCLINRDTYGVIKRVNLDGTSLETFATGIRNTMGFDWHPITGDLWFNDHGRDWLGDDIPSDELNHAPIKGLDFGFPYCHQGDLSDPEFGGKIPCDSFTPPKLNHGAHVAPNGLRFYSGNTFPDKYKNSIFIAQHGSWNRTVKSGYRITVVHLADDGNRLLSNIFADGWTNNNRVFGRPVDLIVSPAGDLLVTDDHRGVIYRITYLKN